MNDADAFPAGYEVTYRVHVGSLVCSIAIFVESLHINIASRKPDYCFATQMAMLHKREPTCTRQLTS